MMAVVFRVRRSGPLFHVDDHWLSVYQLLYKLLISGTYVLVLMKLVSKKSLF